MFRLLGLLAALDLRLNRIRFNFVPLNLALAGVLLWGVSLGVARVLDGPGDIAPRTVTVADLAAGRVATGSFVRVSGFIEPGLILELGKKGRNGTLETVSGRLRLLHDGGSQAVWLMRVRAALEVGRGRRSSACVRPLPQAARDATAREGRAIGSRVPSTGVLIEHGAQPRSFVSGAAHLALCAPPLALLAWVWIKRRQIFRPGPRVTAVASSAGDAIDLRVSGRLRLDARTSRQFVEVPAGLGWMEGGGLSVAANVDASSYLMGVRAIAREGLWTLAIPAGATLSVVVGEMAFGGGVRPAARVVVRVGGRVSERLTLTFGSGAQRDRVLTFLSSVFVPHRAAA